MFQLGREPWSSGHVRRGYEFETQHWMDHVLRLTFVKLYRYLISPKIKSKKEARDGTLKKQCLNSGQCLAERLLSTPEYHGSNPVIGDFLNQIFIVDC